MNLISMIFLLSIKYEIYIADGYGTQDDAGNWNGLVGELVNRYKTQNLNL